MSTRKNGRTKPLFKKKNQLSPVLKTLILIILIIALVFVGFLLGEPLLGLFEDNTPANSDVPPVTEPTDTSETEATTTAPTTTEQEPTTVTDPPEPEVIPKGTLRVSFVTSEDYKNTLDDAIAYALENDYRAICVELVANGGMIYYTTENALAISGDAVAKGALPVDEICSKISSSGLIPYAEISALTDHIVSWLDRSICYLFADGSSKWLDNSASKGGKPWISVFSDSAKAYINSFVTEISDAGFAGIIANDFIFPPFRSTDLEYVGSLVKDPKRYEALCEFANSMHETLGAAKDFAISVNAKDIISGNCEILRGCELLSSKTVYVRFNSSDIGDKIIRDNGTAVSFSGLSDYHKIKTVFRLVEEKLEGTDIIVIPVIDSDIINTSLVDALVESGYDQENIEVYFNR